WKASAFGEKIGFKTYLVRSYFSLITWGKAKIYYAITKEGEVAHTSYLIPKCSKFPFMKKNEFEIGPCETKEKFRGQGIYPFVLNRIVCSAQNPGTKFYMIVDESNISSIKGIEKAGFEKRGLVEKTRFLKRYRLYEENNG
ncbi:MAG: hypothetical protein IKC64_02260, partial [Clostridia bacterium]|nr:hypothetical protein [Clostridia bacterium]